MPKAQSPEPIAQSPEPLSSAIESLLFVSDEPLSLHRLSGILGTSASEVEKGLADLERACQGRGVRLAKVSGGFQLLTRPEFAPFVHRLRQPRPDRLSRSALETLAIIAYKQPVTRPDIDQIRGVDSSYCLDALLSRRLIKEAGRKNSPGRPFIYRTTELFLRTFGLSSVSDLPPLRGDLATISLPPAPSLSTKEMPSHPKQTPLAAPQNEPD